MAAPSPGPTDVATQLARILGSRTFARAPALRRFLEHVVRGSLAGRTDQLKEYAIGVDVFDRGSSFDPRTDTIVRVEARRLRARLREYYDREGAADSVHIGLPKGHYVPEFAANGEHPSREAEAAGAEDGVGHAPATARGPIIPGAVDPTNDGSRGARAALDGSAPTPRRNTGRRAAAVLPLLVGALVWAWRTGEPPDPPSRVSVTPLTVDGGWKEAPRFSPDGDRVAYQWTGSADDNWDVYVRALGPAATPLRLTDHPAMEGSPAWSPDGREIAFVRDGDDGTAILAVPATGGRARKLADVPHPARWLHQRTPWLGSLSWFPDGRSLVFAERPSAGAPAHIVRVRLDTAQREVLTSPPETSRGDFHPRLSPDGRWLAFVRALSKSWGQEDVWVQEIGSGPARRLTAERYNWCFGLAWTPNGSAVFFTAPHVAVGTSARLRRVSLAGGGAQPVPGAGTGTSTAALHGNRMVYAERSTRPQDIWRVAVRGGPEARVPRKLIASSQGDANPAYSPDGRRIAFESSRGGSGNVWVSDADGRGAFQLTRFETHAGTPRWSPDGRWISFDSSDSGNWDVYVIAAEGGVPRRLTPEPSEETRSSWSRDGRRVYFSSNRSGSDQIWSAPVDGGTAVQVTRSGGGYALESPDGRWVYFARHDNSGLWRVPVGGGEESPAVELPVGWQDWALAGEGLYYTSRQVRGRREEYAVHRLDLGSGKVETVFRETGDLRHLWLSVSPDERWILYSAMPGYQAELMLMEELPGEEPRTPTG